ncbi:MAG: energy-coupling factor transporter transmembrane protein EcfT [Oscillospiraceae bacterium]|nr:energy-coupling factor transporter transmembrane protein EcfT [Oscillospiraceae bacterium]
MRSVNPAMKFLSLLAVTLILAYEYDLLLNLTVFAASVLLMLISKVRLRTLLLLMLPIILAAAGMFFTGYRFSAEGNMPVNAEIMNIGSSALLNGLTQASRVLAYAGIGFLFALTTDRIMLISSFRRQLHLPQVFAYGLLAAWGVFPHMVQEYKRTRAAFRARGLRVFPVSPALLKPLLVKSVRWSEELAVAMESKGFSGQAQRTELDPVRVRAGDIAFLLLSVGIPAALAFLI